MIHHVEIASNHMAHAQIGQSVHREGRVAVHFILVEVRIRDNSKGEKPFAQISSCTSASFAAESVEPSLNMPAKPSPSGMPCATSQEGYGDDGFDAEHEPAHQRRHPADNAPSMQERWLEYAMGIRACVRATPPGGAIGEAIALTARGV